MRFSSQLRTLRPWRERASRWDLLVLPSVLGLLFLAAFAAKKRRNITLFASLRALRQIKTGHYRIVY